MKKFSYVLLAVCLILSFTACGKKNEKEGTKNDTAQEATAQGNSTQDTSKEGSDAVPAEAAIVGEEYDTGNFKVVVPNGWKHFPQHDMFSDDKNALNPNMLQIAKGAESELDVFSKPSITITYSGPDSDLSLIKDVYDNVEDMEDVVTGDHTWKVFRGESSGYKIFMLFEDQGKIQYQAYIIYEAGNDKIDLNDADVQAILSSIQTTNAEDIAQVGEG